MILFLYDILVSVFPRDIVKKWFKNIIKKIF